MNWNPYRVPDPFYTEQEKASVNRGAAWLDENAPGWEDRMVLPEFNIGSICKCVFGQVFKSEADERNLRTGCYGMTGFDYGADVLRSQPLPVGQNPYEVTTYYGFDHGPETTYEGLQAAWDEVIAERQAAKA